MTEQKYKININNIHINYPDVITSPVDSADEKYKLTISKNTQTIKEYNITKTIYHSKTNAKIKKDSSINKIIPLWCLKETILNNLHKNIGKVILTLVYDSADTKSNKKLFKLVGTAQTNTDLAADLETTTDKDITNNILESNFYKSNFFFRGGKSNECKYIIDLNKKFEIPDVNKYIALGLEVNENPSADSVIKIETYVELIS